MRGSRPRLSPLLVLTVTLIGGCAAPPPDADSPAFEAAVRQAVIPGDLAAGEAAFAANCAVCHGDRGLGSEQGPPLVNVIYEPSHHADIAFHLAVDRGVRAHHWTFGDMPPLPTVETSQVTAIVAYIRFLQRQAGIQ